MALPPEDEAPPDAEASIRPELQVIEASATKERRCADCGKRTDLWKPVRRKGLVVILCSECAAKPSAPDDVAACPQCGAALGPRDSFCGKCGTRIEYACPQCNASLDADDVFCGACGARLA